MQLVEFIPSHARSGVLLVGFPSHGVVGTVAAKFLIEHLGMRRIGGLHDPRIPPAVVVENGLAGSQVSLHVHETVCDIGKLTERLYVLKSDTVISPGLYHDAADAIMKWARDRGVELVVGLEGVRSDAVATSEVKGFADHAGGPFLQRLDVTPADGLTFTGFSAALVLAGHRHDVPATALLTRANPEVPDAEAAARLLGVIDAILPNVELNPEKLAERARRLEVEVHEAEASHRHELQDLEERAPLGYMYG